MKLKGRSVQNIKTFDNGIRLVVKGRIIKNDIRNNKVEVQTEMGNVLKTNRKIAHRILM